MKIFGGPARTFPRIPLWLSTGLDQSAVVAGDADLAAIFMHNEGYSTMCGHAVIALARYAVDRRRVMNPARLDSDDDDLEFPVTVQCPCGPVTAYVERRSEDRSTTGRVRFHSVPAFAYALGQCVRHSLSFGRRNKLYCPSVSPSVCLFDESPKNNNQI